MILTKSGLLSFSLEDGNTLKSEAVYDYSIMKNPRLIVAGFLKNDSGPSISIYELNQKFTYFKKSPIDLDFSLTTKSNLSISAIDLIAASPSYLSILCV